VPYTSGSALNSGEGCLCMFFCCGALLHLHLRRSGSLDCCVWPASEILPPCNQQINEEQLVGRRFQHCSMCRLFNRGSNRDAVQTKASADQSRAGCNSTTQQQCSSKEAGAEQSHPAPSINAVHINTAAPEHCMPVTTSHNALVIFDMKSHSVFPTQQPLAPVTLVHAKALQSKLAR
jgi:hypothetical protein